MGCHTWCFKRLKYTREDVVSFAKLQQEHNELHYGKHPHTWTEGEKLLAGNKEIISDLAADYIGTNLRPDGGHIRVSVRNGLAYQECGYHDIYRVGGYPEDELHSLQETLDFLAKRQREEKYISEDEHTMPSLEEFWTKYPTGMITMG